MGKRRRIWEISLPQAIPQFFPPAFSIMRQINVLPGDYPRKICPSQKVSCLMRYSESKCSPQPRTFEFKRNQLLYLLNIHKIIQTYITPVPKQGEKNFKNGIFPGKINAPPASYHPHLLPLPPAHHSATAMPRAYIQE